MTERSSFQRFTGELRRRHVPQTVAVYLVMAWAAIEFADVIVPNLDGPPWIVTAVIVAAGVGLPAVLVLAWIFDWGPDGVHRTPADPEPSPNGDPTATPAAPSFSAPWMMAVAVLVVGIASALAVAALVSGNGGEPAGGGEAVSEDEERPPERRRPDMLVPPGFDLGALDSLGMDDLMDLDSLDVGELVGLARRVAAEAGINVLIQEPEEWGLGRGVPATLAEGDTLVVVGMARDSAGVAAVEVDGTTVARADDPREVLRFTGHVVGTRSLGLRRVTIRMRTADGREISRDYQVIQRPAGSEVRGGSHPEPGGEPDGGTEDAADSGARSPTP